MPTAQALATTLLLPPSFADSSVLQASSYPRKKGGSLFHPRSLPSHPSSHVVRVPSPRSSTAIKPSLARNRPLPTPPSSDSSDMEPISPRDHLGSFPLLLAFFASEKLLLKEKNRERRRQAASDRAARKEVRSRVVLRYPKSHDRKIKEILDGQQQEEAGDEGADEAEEDEAGPLLRCSSMRSSFASLKVSLSDSTINSSSSRSSPITAIHTLPDLARQDLPSSPFASKSTASVPSPLSSSFRPVLSHRRRFVKKILVTPSPVVLIPSTSELRNPSVRPAALPSQVLDLSTPIPPSSTSPQLRALADRLIAQFPDVAKEVEVHLAVEDAITSGQQRGFETVEASEVEQVHVFVDHSNILVGLLQQPISPPVAHRSPQASASSYNFQLSLAHSHLIPRAVPILPNASAPASPPSVHFFANPFILPTPPSSSFSRHQPKLRTLSHPALALLLLRGRDATTKALVASSPLHQSLDDLQIPSRGPWDVTVLRRVKERELYEGMLGDGTTTTSGSETEGVARVAMRKKRAARPLVSSLGGFKEQAVDELLQLKILRVLALHTPKPGSNTIILATGDAAGSPLNPGGFRECVEIALEKGWNVEVWGWRRGIGTGWREVERIWRKKDQLEARVEGKRRMVVRELDEWEPYLRGEEGG